MKDVRKYHSKLLLFGEYSVLEGSKALSIPFRRFSGHFEFASCGVQESLQAQKSQISLIHLHKHLSNPQSQSTLKIPDLTRLSQDLIAGLYFNSNIPQNYGLGSSGALVAAIFDRYYEGEGLPIPELRNELGQIEAVFHRQSSGIDPLVSYLDQAVFVDTNSIVPLSFDLNGFGAGIEICLIDSGIPGATKKGILASQNRPLPIDYIGLNNQIIDRLIHLDQGHILSELLDLSQLQYKVFGSKFTDSVGSLLKVGLSNQQFAVKLCGSGGGGYYLAFTADYPLLEAEANKIGLAIERMSTRPPFQHKNLRPF